MKRLARPRHLLFDLDGTLVDSVADLTASANATRASYGLVPLTETVIASHVGDGAGMLILRSFADAPSTLDRDEALGRFRDHYFEHCLERTQPYPGVLDTLERLHPRPMAIVSNKPQSMCEKIARGLGLDRWVAVVVGARPELAVKPDAAMLRVALAELGRTAPAGADVWMVGDSANDVRSGQALGVTTIAVSYGLADVRALADPPPDAVVDRFSALRTLVDDAAGREAR
jgi:phosphoglycolate phosphatase